jgi:hypothetical protein
MRNIPTRTIALTYPGFQALPSAVKRMLVISESFFFDNQAGQQPGTQESVNNLRQGSQRQLRGHLPFSGWEWLN